MDNNQISPTPQDSPQDLSQNIPNYQMPESTPPSISTSTALPVSPLPKYTQASPSASPSPENAQASPSASPAGIFSPGGNIKKKTVKKRSHPKLRRSLMALSVLIICGVVGFLAWQKFANPSMTVTATQDYGDKMPTPKTSKQIAQILENNGYTCESPEYADLVCWESEESGTVLALVYFVEYSSFQELRSDYLTSKAEFVNNPYTEEASEFSQLLDYVDNTSHYNHISATWSLQNTVYSEMLFVENTYVGIMSLSSETNQKILDLLEYW